MLKISLSLGLIIFLALSCTKPDADISFQTQSFQTKQFVPSGEYEAKEEVLAFLSFVAANNHSPEEVTPRDAFPDKEANEGRWVLEGTANYEKNVNLPGKEATHTKVYDLDVATYLEGQTYKMIGSDMTSRYTDLMTQVAAEEQATGTLALLFDLEILTVSSTATHIKATVVYGKPPNATVLGGILWPSAGTLISIGTFESSAGVGQGCVEWIPETAVFQWQYPQPYLTCTVSGACLRSQTSISPTLYNQAWLTNDIITAIAIGNDYLNDINSTGPNGQASTVPFSLKGCIVESDAVYSSNPTTWTDFLYVSTIVAAGYSWCY